MPSDLRSCGGLTDRRVKLPLLGGRPMGWNEPLLTLPLAG
jgi:hypothetical protein